LTQVALTLKKRFPVPVSFRQLNEECSTIEKLANFYEDRTPMDAEPAAGSIQEGKPAGNYSATRTGATADTTSRGPSGKPGKLTAY
jgi:hypothetical protein